jgi:hypothetical protein
MEARELIETFYDLSLPQRNKNLVDIVLMKNRNVVGDFTIKMTWQGDLPESEKSPLGYQLVQAFSKMGWINHSVWTRETSLFLLNGRSVNGKN